MFIFVVEKFLLILESSEIVFEFIHLFDDVDIAGMDVELDLEGFVNVCVNIGGKSN